MIGIDIGRVIISGDTDKAKQFFTDEYLKVRAIAGAFEGIQKIVQKYGRNNVFLVSKCGEIVQEKSLNWLQHHDFFHKTGVLKTNIHFCLERHEKKGICEAMGITTFIDDRFSVLEHLSDLDKCYLFNPSQEELTAFETALQSKTEIVTVVKSWDDLIKDFPL